MKAVAYTHCYPIEKEESLLDVELPDPHAHHHDLLVEVRAVSVNPVDTKLRRNADPVGEKRVLGFDCAGVVRAIGPEVKRFGIGDEVWYAGSIQRPGCNSELHLVDERIAGRRPRSLSFAAAASLPLTAITAWELLFERLGIPRDPTALGRLLIIGGGGGVGSIAIQLARQLTGLSVIATASRAETAAWCREMGAHEVVDHSRDLVAELAERGVHDVDYVFCTNAVRRNWEAAVKLVRPLGRIGLIEQGQGVDALELFPKGVSLSWENMFARASFHTPDMEEQHHLLETLAILMDRGTIRTTMTEHFGHINAANLKRAHALVESGHVRGKVVLEGF